MGRVGNPPRICACGDVRPSAQPPAPGRDPSARSAAVVVVDVSYPDHRSDLRSPVIDLRHDTRATAFLLEKAEAIVAADSPSTTRQIGRP